MKEGIPSNSLVSHYRLIDKIGEGGMGEVYLAQDTKLERKVALKVLPETLAADVERLRRFGQEARAASALNHPNILTIYEIGVADGTNYISTEFVDGETLRDALHAKSVSLEKTLDIAIQAASALAAAHDAGIIHRDIKPENIMLRRDGLVKVLDFGLAKLSENSPPNVDTEGETRAQVKTAPGVIMGTVQYMSPEQTRGKVTDARSDIWSLGCVIYEMTTGRPPFTGETTADLIAEIVKMDPEPISRAAPHVPDRLDEVISKAIEKNPDERYQTVKDLLIDLRRLKKKLDSTAEADRSYSPESSTSTSVVEVSRSESGAALSTTSGTPVTTVSSAQLISQGIRTHKTASAILGLAALVVVGSLAYLGYRVWTMSGSSAPGKSMKITRLTSSGVAGAVSISSDGKYVTHSSGLPASRGLWVRQTSEDSAVQIVPDAPGRFSGTTFSPGNDRVYYAWQGAQEASGTLYSVPTLGGAPVHILDKVAGPVSFSPDGKRFAVIRGEGELITANPDGSDVKTVKTLDASSEWLAGDGPSWSPDGKLIAVGKGSSKGRLGMTVVGISPIEGVEIPLTDRIWPEGVARVAWLPDGSGLIVNAYESTTLTQVWYLPYPKGEPVRITNDLRGYGSFSLGVTKDGSTIATVEEDRRSQAWSVSPGDDESTAVQLNKGKNDAENVAIAPNGSIFFTRQTGEVIDVWSMNADGSGQKQLTKDNFREEKIDVSPDGRYVVYTSDRAGLPHVWRMNVDGTEPKQLTFGDDYDDGNPHISPDGKWVIYNSWRTGKSAPWRVSIDGGESQLLYDGSAVVGPVSPDSKYVLCGVVDEQARNEAIKPALIPIEPGGRPEFLNISISFNPSDAKWAGDTVYVNTGTNISRVPLKGGPAKQVTNFKTESIKQIAVSSDGKRFVISRGQIINDVVLIKDFR